MNIILINPPDENTIVEFPDENGNSLLEADDYGYFPPLGLLYIASYLEKYSTGHNIELIDCVAQDISHDDLRVLLANKKPDIIGLTSFTISLIDVVTVAKNIRSISSDIHICLGGHHPIAYPFEASQLECIDSIVVGEGEKAFFDLVNNINNSLPLTDITGVYTKGSISSTGTPIKDKRFLNSLTVEPAYIENIDELPFPNRNFIKGIGYNSIVGVSTKFTTILSSRGCPYLCTFCNVPYKKYRARSPENIIDEIEECLGLGYEEFHFYDDLFNITPQRVISICDEIEKRELKFTWDFRGRVNSLNKEALYRAKRAGCRMISFGVETGSNEGFKALKKGCTVEKVQNAFKWCKEVGIITIADYMIGLPHEKSKSEIWRNIDFLIKLKPDFAQFNILTLYPHTEAYNQAIAKGLTQDGRWQEFSLNPTSSFTVDHWEEYVSMADLVKIHRQAYRKFYFRPSYIIKRLFSIRSIYEFKKGILGVLKLLKFR